MPLGLHVALQAGLQGRLGLHFGFPIGLQAPLELHLAVQTGLLAQLGICFGLPSGIQAPFGVHFGFPSRLQAHIELHVGFPSALLMQQKLDFTVGKLHFSRGGLRLGPNATRRLFGSCLAVLGDLLSYHPFHCGAQSYGGAES